MKTTEFFAIIAANANKTSRIKSYSGRWVTGVNAIPNQVTRNIGRLISFLQNLLDNNSGDICNSDEGLLIYNFQTAMTDNYYSLSAVVKNITDLLDTGNIVGRPVQFIVNGETTEVCNCSHFMLQVGMLTWDEVKDGVVEQPIVYGKYGQFKPTTSFVVFDKLNCTINWDVFFTSNYYLTKVKQFHTFDTLLEARDFILAHSGVYSDFILELAGAKEDFEQLKPKLYEYIVKVVNYFSNEILITCNPSAKAKEEKAEDEVKRIKEAHLQEYQQYHKQQA